MKVKTITIAILAMMLLVSCDESGQSPEAPESLSPTIGQGSYSQEYTVDTYTTITLDGLKPDSMYGIIVTDSSSRAAEARSTSSILTPMGKDCYLYWSGNDGETSISFSGAELGLSGQAAVKFIEYEPREDGLKIDTANEAPDYYLDGVAVYEEFYKIPISELEDNVVDLTRVALLERYISKNASQSTDCGIVVDGRVEDIHEAENSGVVDMSDWDYLCIFSRVAISKGSTMREIIPQTPVKLTAEIEEELSVPQVYEVPASGEAEMVLELTLGDNEPEDFLFPWNALFCRYAYGDEAGMHHPYGIPISYDQATKTAVIYLGKVPHNVIIDIVDNDSGISGGTIELRQISTGEKELIDACTIDVSGYMTPGKSADITIPEGARFLPVIFNATTERDSHDLYVGMSHLGTERLRLVYSHHTGIGYSHFSLTSRQAIEDIVLDGEALECGFMYFEEPAEGSTVSFQFSKDNSFVWPEVPDKVVPCEGVPSNEFSNSVTLMYYERLVLTGLKEGAYYAVMMENAYMPPDIGWDLMDGIAVFRADSSTLEVDASDIAKSSSATLRLMKLDVETMNDGKVSFSLSSDTACHVDDDGRFYFIDAFTPGTRPSGDVMLKRTDTSKDFDSRSRGLFMLDEEGGAHSSTYVEDVELSLDGNEVFVSIMRLTGAAMLEYDMDLVDIIGVDDVPSDSQAILKLDASKGERLLLIGIGEGMEMRPNDFSDVFTTSGDHFFGFVALGEVEEGKYGFYVAPCDEPVYILIRDYSGIESVSFGEYDPDLHRPTEVDSSNGTVTLTIPESGYMPIIFTGTEEERSGIASVSIEGTEKAYLRIYCGYLGRPSSYGNNSARVDNPARFDSDAVLQHGYIEDEPGSVTLTFTRY